MSALLSCETSKESLLAKRGRLSGVIAVTMPQRVPMRGGGYRLNSD